MEGKPRLTSLLVLALLVASMCAAALAYACVPSARIISVKPERGPAGSTTTVSGTDFASGPITLHWDSVTGPLLGVTSGPRFSMPVNVPEDAAPGAHVIIAVSDTGLSRASAPFEVIVPGSPAGGEGGGGSGDSGAGDGAHGRTSGHGGGSGGGDTGEPFGAIGPLLGRDRLRSLALRRCLATSSARSKRSRRRRCLRRYGATPGRVRQVKASGFSQTEIVLSFRAAGTDRGRPPAARSYLVKQSRRPIGSRRSFSNAQTLCGGACRFALTHVGERVTLTIADLRPRTTYYYVVAARDNVSGRLGRRSRAVRARTR